MVLSMLELGLLLKLELEQELKLDLNMAEVQLSSSLVWQTDYESLVDSLGVEWRR